MQLRSAALSFAGTCLVAVATMAPARASADERTAQLVYAVPPAAETACPDEASFQNQVAARLGYAPFKSEAPRTVSVRIERRGQRLHARVELREGQRSAGRPRELESGVGECESLAAAAATAVSIALDPLGASRAQAGATAETAEKTAPAATPDESASAPEPIATAPATSPPSTQNKRDTSPPRDRFVAPSLSPSFSLVLMPVVALGVAPGVTVGGALALAGRLGNASLEIEGRVETQPVAASLDDGLEASAQVFSGALAPCIHGGVAFGCLVGRVGAFEARTDSLAEPSSESGPHAAVGARGGVELALSDRFALRGTLELAVPLVRPSITIRGQQRWEAPLVQASAGLGLRMSL